MNSEQNDLDKLLKDNLSDKTAGVPDFVWDRIEEELFPKKKRRGFFWLFFGLGLLLLGIFTACIVFTHTTPDAGTLSASKRSISPTAETPNRLRKEQPAPAQTVKNPAGSQTIASETALLSAAANNKTKATPNTRKTPSSPASLLTRKDPGAPTARGQQAGKGETASPLTLRDKALQAAAIPVNTEPDLKQEPLAATPTPVDTLAAIIPDSIKVADSNPADSLPPPQPKVKRFSVGIHGGASLYDMAVFKEYFTSGQLSNRSFTSGGFEAGADFSYRFTDRLSVYGGAAFNRKTTSFNYNLAITEAQYFNTLLSGERIDLAGIVDDGNGNCFLAEHVSASYRVDSWLLSIGATYELLTWNRFTLGADLRFSMNLQSALEVRELTVISVPDYEIELFNYFKPGAGLALDYRVNDYLTVGTAPMFSLQLSRDQQSFYAGTVKEVILPLRVRFWF